jgi:3-oxoacyl-[acyl-carrier protein] reductase
VDLQLQDTCFVVTGGTSGLGFAAAGALVAEGAHAVVVGRDPQRADQALRQLGDSASQVVADLADDATPARALAAARATGLPIGGALISVGGPPPGTPMSVTDQQWRESFDTVFVGTLRMIRAVAELPEDARTHTLSIAVVLSTSAKSPITGLAISNGLRPGLAMLVKDLADELGPHRIRVNALLPGRLATERIRQLEGLADDPAAARAGMERAIPLRRYGRPEELGAVAAFLLSPQSGYVSGAAIPVDGGALRAL